MLRFLLFFNLCLLLLSSLALGQSALAATGEQTSWRIRFADASIVQGEFVLLGEIASPVGEMPEELWKELSVRKLWPAPPKGKAVNMTRPRLQEAVVQTMNDLAPYCLFPGSMALQRGGALLTKEVIQAQAVKELTPFLAGIDGESSLMDFRLPNAIFLEHQGQTLSISPAKNMEVGRVSLRLDVKELDGRVVQKLTGSVLLESWQNIPCATKPLNKGDILSPEHITFVRLNLASLRSNIWDGRGGPWRILRPIEVNQPIYQSDLGHIPTVRKGSKVHILFASKGITLKVLGEALSDGAIGENISVRNIESKKEVYGVVVDSQTVRVNTQQEQ